MIKEVCDIDGDELWKEMKKQTEKGKCNKEEVMIQR